MDRPPPNVEPSKEASKSWQTRYQEFEEDESSTLGQHNLDDTSTRTKITHIEGLGFGVIGSVLSLAYGCWLNQPAALLVMQFSFRAKERSRRYKNAEISICFESGTASSGGPPNRVSPVVRSWYPKNNRTTKPLTNRFGGNPSHTPPSASARTLDLSQSTGQSVWPAEEFWIRGRTWSRKNREEPHVVLWSMTEAEGSVTGISEQIRLAVIVTFSGHFRAVVDIKATLGFGLNMRNFPWSRDDPVLFDGNTSKGKSPPTSDFNAITDQELLDYVSDPNISFLNTSQAPNETASDQNKRSEQSTAAAKTYSASRRVYRVRGLLPFWSRAISVEILSASIKVREDSVRVHSFAENPYRAEQMAIVSLEDSPNGVLIPNTKMEWLVQAQLSNEEATTEIMDDKPIQLLFDSHFYGFSELGILSIDSSACIADIIAIGGLGGHAYGTFKERGGIHMWLEDSLPLDLQTPARVPNLGPARILIYGYDTHIENSQSFQMIEDLASQLRMSLRAIRRGNSCMRPIIFIGHSLGGLLIKELLILLSKGDGTDQCNFKSTRGALFFGVPNCGMDNTSLITMMETQPNRDFLDSLSTNSPFLKQQAQSFSTVFDFHDSIIYSFYETRVSPIATMVNGKLAMKGDPVVLVGKDSATHSRPWEMDPRFIIAVDRSHSDLVKFERYSDDYEHVLACIRLLLENSADIVSRRFNAPPPSFQ